MDIRSCLTAAALLAALAACDSSPEAVPPANKQRVEAAALEERLARLCASRVTAERLKALLIDEAARRRGGRPDQIDRAAAGVRVEMLEPRVRSRDEELNVTVCSGLLLLEFPPDADGQAERLAHPVEFAAESAGDGSGLVFHLDGAEPLVERLARLGGASAGPGAPSAPHSFGAGGRGFAPSFDCRYARSHGEQLVCGSPLLAAKDREMAGLYYAVVAGADPATREHLRRSRDAFLRRRDLCRSAGCIVSVYAARSAEIRAIRDGG